MYTRPAYASTPWQQGTVSNMRYEHNIEDDGIPHHVHDVWIQPQPKNEWPASGGGGGPIPESDSYADEGDDEEDKGESSTKEELHASSRAEVD